MIILIWNIACRDILTCTGRSDRVVMINTSIMLIHLHVAQILLLHYHLLLLIELAISLWILIILSDHHWAIITLIILMVALLILWSLLKHTSNIFCLAVVWHWTGGYIMILMIRTEIITFLQDLSETYITLILMIIIELLWKSIGIITHWRLEILTILVLW